jgi:dienelactone hydrolase
VPAPEVVVLHHLLGVTPGVRAFADRVRALGVGVRVPDLLDGVVHAGMAPAAAHLEALGIDVVVARAEAALADLAPGAVLVGLSLGAVPAQRTAQLRGDCAGAVLVGACLPPDAFGPAWPAGTPVRVHAAVDDPVFRDEGDRDAAEALVAAVPGARLRLHPGSGHLLTEEGSPDLDDAVVAAVLDDVAELLGV